MGDKFPDFTPVVDRGGRRVRLYERKRTDRPGTKEKREKRALGLKWCSGCSAWMEAAAVTKQGTCKPCQRIVERTRYAEDAKFREYRLSQREKRYWGVEEMPQEAREIMADLFLGKCAYCGGQIDCFDHFVPWSKGGKTIPGNMIPACIPCNSGKKDMDPIEFLDSKPAGSIPNVEFLIEYLVTMGTI